MTDYPGVNALNGFSTALRDLVRDYENGSKGCPMRLDGNWRTYTTVKMRFVDVCQEYDLERFRNGSEVYPTGGGALAARQNQWRAVHEKLLGSTRTAP